MIRFNKSMFQFVYERVRLAPPPTGLETPVISYELPSTITENDAPFNIVFSSTSTETPITVTIGDGVGTILTIADITDSGAVVTPLLQGSATIILSQEGTESLNPASVTIVMNVGAVVMPAPVLAETTLIPALADFKDNVLDITYPGVGRRYNPMSSYRMYIQCPVTIVVKGRSTWSRLGGETAGLAIELDGELIDRMVFTNYTDEQSKTISLTGTGVKVLTIYNGTSEAQGSDNGINPILGTSLTGIVLPVGASFVTKRVKYGANRLIARLDSLTSGIGAAKPDVQGVWVLLRKANPTWDILLDSYGGRRASQYAIEINQEKLYWQAYMAGAVNKVFWDFDGTNDYADKDTQSKIDALVDTVKSIYTATKTLFPACTYYMQTMMIIAGQPDRAAMFRASLTTMAATTDAILVDGVALVDNTGSNTADGTHDNATGQRIRATNMAAILGWNVPQ